jgi:hypothetical protein
MHNPYYYHAAVHNDDMFFGHQQLLADLIRGLNNPHPNSAIIFGGRRCGKTSLIGKLERMLNKDVCTDSGRYFVPCNFNLQGGRPLQRCDDFFLWVLEKLGETWERKHDLEQGAITEELHGNYHSKIVKGPVEAFIYAFQSLEKYGKRIRLVLLIDEWDKVLALGNWGSRDLRPNLRTLLSNSPVVEELGLILAGATQMYKEVIEHDSPLENVLDHHLLPPLSNEATLALAREPNGGRLSEVVAKAIWEYTGGQPCTTQFILHELWDELGGKLGDATVEDILDIAESFDDRTRHFSTWTETLGQTCSEIYRFLVERDEPISYREIRQRFSELEIIKLRIAIETLLYHGLIYRTGRGRRTTYNIAGQMYCNWFLSAGKLITDELVGPTDSKASQIVVHGDYVAGDKSTGVDQRGQEVQGSQTNIAGSTQGPVLSGKFEGPVSVGGGEAVDLRGSQGAVYKPSGQVKQQFGDINIEGDGNVIGDHSSSHVVKSGSEVPAGPKPKSSNYLDALEQMRELIAEHAIELMPDFLVIEGHLRANLSKELSGSTEAIGTEKKEILDQLDNLARKANLDVTFGDLIQ